MICHLEEVNKSSLFDHYRPMTRLRQFKWDRGISILSLPKVKLVEPFVCGQGLGLVHQLEYPLFFYYSVYYISVPRVMSQMRGHATDVN